MSKPQKLFDPESPAELLLGWLVHAHKGRDRHDLAARVYERGRYMLGVPTLIASTIVGTSVFSALSSPSGGVPSLWVGLFSVLAAILAALQTFLDLPARSAQHRATGVKYKAAIRELEQMRATLAPGAAPPVRSDQRRASDAGRTGGSGPRHHASDLLCNRAAVFKRSLRSPGTWALRLRSAAVRHFRASSSRRKVDAAGLTLDR